MTGMLVTYVLAGVFIFGWPTWKIVSRDISRGTTPWIAVVSGVGAVLLWPWAVWFAWKGKV